MQHPAEVSSFRHIYSLIVQVLYKHTVCINGAD